MAFLAMELVEGEGLELQIAHRPIPVDEAIPSRQVSVPGQAVTS